MSKKETNNDLLHAVNEKLEKLDDKVDNLALAENSNTNDISHIKKDISDIKKAYVTLHQFTPVRLIVYGLVSSILTAVFCALIALVIL